MRQIALKYLTIESDEQREILYNYEGKKYHF